jgi:hypothetical protein
VNAVLVEYGPRSRTPEMRPFARFARIDDQLAVFRDRELGRETGRCDVCGGALRSQQDCVHEAGVVVHLRCRSPRPASREPPPL